MFLTKECDYAIRAVRALADYEIKTVAIISELEHIPLNFAYKILKKLERVGIVESFRGKLGGYGLSKKLDQISVLDIISATNENLYINECLRPGHICPNNTENSRCSVHQALAHIQEDLSNTLKNTTIDMVL